MGAPGGLRLTEASDRLLEETTAVAQGPVFEWLEAQARQRASDGGCAGDDAFRAVMSDALVRSGSSLRAVIERFDLVLDNLAQGVCLFDADRRLILSNRRFAEVYNVDPAMIRPGMLLDEIIGLRYRAGCGPNMQQDPYQRWRNTVNRSGLAHDSMFELQDGRVIAVRHQGLAQGGWLATHEDISSRVLIERRNAHLAQHESITGLPNRSSICEHLQNGLENSSDTSPCALLLISLDGLRRVSTSLTRTDREGLLRLVADRLRQLFSPPDILGHTGAHEFAVILRGAGSSERVTSLAEQALHGLAGPVWFQRRPIVLDPYAGVTTARSTDIEPETMLAQASVALDRAQTEAKARARLFTPAMDALLDARHALEADLREAVDRMSFELHYQPQCSLPSRAVEAFEALIRWNHATRGPIPPTIFIPLAEELGLIDRIGEWVLDRACADCATWPAEIGVAVNVSARQFEGGNLADAVRGVLARHGLAANRLELEITETCIIADPEHAAATMRELRDIGVGIAMDDFGAGYSSLSYLPRLPFNKLKIDRSFVSVLDPDGSQTGPHVSIVRAIIGICRDLQVSCIAEGIESESQLAVLVGEHCQAAQGYLLGRPVPVGEVPRILSRNSSHAVAPRRRRPRAISCSATSRKPQPTW